MKRFETWRCAWCPETISVRGASQVHHFCAGRNGRETAFKVETAEQRFWARVDKDGPNGCWVWTGSIQKPHGTNTGGGYGRFGRTGGANEYAHRFSYELANGILPEGLQIDHLCRNRACVNPAHLEAVTQTENIMRGESPWAKRARQTHCKRGHEFTPENTRLNSVSGTRSCETCRKLRLAAIRIAKAVA